MDSDFHRMKICMCMQPWLVAGFHRPIYTDAVDGNTLGGHVSDQRDEQAAWELLFFQYQVDM